MLRTFLDVLASNHLLSSLTIENRSENMSGSVSSCSTTQATLKLSARCCYSGAIQLEETLGYDKVIGVDSWRIDRLYPSVNKLYRLPSFHRFIE